MESRRLLITGLVQGLGFRFHMVAKAKELGVTGWVRNRRDGRVEAMISGSGEQIAAMIDQARRGPPGAKVSQVSVEEPEQPIPINSFVQLDTLQYRRCNVKISHLFQLYFNKI